MNILYIAHEGGNDFNGASRSLLTIVKHFSDDASNRIYVLIPQKGGKLERELTSLNCTLLVRPFHRWMVYRERRPWRWWKAKYLWKAQCKENEKLVGELADYCVKHQIELIHTNSSVVSIGALVSAKTGIPHIWHFREFAQEDFNMYPLVSQKEWCSTVSRHHSAIITVSEAVRLKYLSLMPKANIITVYNGIPMPQENPPKTERSDEKFNLLISGLISAAKGQEMAVRVMLKLLEKGYTDIELYLAGKGSTDHLKALCCAYEANFHFLGQVDGLSKLRSEMDVELVCSRSEAFGRVTVEAMAEKLPVIGTNAGGTPELISDGVTGFLVEPNDVDALAEKIEYLYLHRDECRKMGEAAYQSVIHTFTVENLVDRIDSIYREVLQINE